MMPLHHHIHIAAVLTLAASRCAIGSAQSTLSTNTHVVGHNYVHGRVTQTTTQMLYTTFELSLVKAPFNVDVANCYALYGSGNTSMALPPAWQAPNPFGVNIGGVHPAITAIAPSARFDSWLTIGPDSGGAAAQEIASVGIRWHEWTAESGLSTDDGAVFWIDPSKAPPLTASSGVKVGQLTLAIGAARHASFAVQGNGQPGAPDWQSSVKFSFFTGEPPAPPPPASDKTCDVKGLSRKMDHVVDMCCRSPDDDDDCDEGPPSGCSANCADAFFDTWSPACLQVFSDSLYEGQANPMRTFADRCQKDNPGH